MYLPRRSEQGFTLIELMITVVVLAILIAVAVPNMNDAIRKRRIVGAAEAVHAQLQFARSEAIKQSQPVSAVVTTTAPWSVAVAGNAMVSGSEYSGVAIAAAPATTVSFDGVRGLMSAPNTEETITLTFGAQYEMQVRVGMLGRVRICSPTGSTKVGGYAAC